MAVCGLLTAALLVGRPIVHAQAGVPVLNPVVPIGSSVTFTWSAMDGASGYALQAGVAPLNYLITLPVGNRTTFSTSAPAVGIYYARIVALDGASNPIGASAEVSFQVTSMFAPPAAPANLATFLNGTTAVISWDPSVGGGSTNGYILQAGSVPGAADIAQISLPASTTSLAVPAPAGTYHLRVFAANQGGLSLPSNDATLLMPPGGGCSAPPTRTIDQMVFGQYVRLSWAPVPGSAGYLLNVTGTHAVSQFVPAHINSIKVPGAPLGTYQAALTTSFSCGQTAVGPTTTITVDGAAPPGPRTPNPPAGQRLPLPNRFNVVNRVAERFPREFRASCPTEHRGDSNRFLFELVRELRKEDNRWGLNWKRGNFGDMSQDIITYNWGSKPDEGTSEVYIIDIMFSHCGSNPSPGWIDQTQATRDAGTRGAWTLLPYLDAGYPVAGDLAPQQ
jgi:hypothetical protein